MWEKEEEKPKAGWRKWRKPRLLVPLTSRCRVKTRDRRNMVPDCWRWTNYYALRVILVDHLSNGSTSPQFPGSSTPHAWQVESSFWPWISWTLRLAGHGSPWKATVGPLRDHFRATIYFGPARSTMKVITPVVSWVSWRASSLALIYHTITKADDPTRLVLDDPCIWALLISENGPIHSSLFVHQFDVNIGDRM